MATIQYRFRVRRRTAANWASLNEVLLDSEIGLESDTTWDGGGRKFKIGDGSTAWNDLEYAVPDAGGGSGFDPRSRSSKLWDFIEGVTTSTNTGTSFVTNSVTPVVYLFNSAPAPSLIAAESGRPGILELTTGTPSNGSPRLFTTAGLRVKVGGGTMRLGYSFKLPVLSDGTNGFRVILGLRDVISGSAADSIYAEYTHSANSGNWTLNTTASSTTTTENAAVGPAADTWQTVEIEINAGGTEVKLYVDGSEAATITTNIPTATLGVAAWLLKTAGTTARTMKLDYVSFDQQFTASR